MIRAPNRGPLSKLITIRCNLLISAANLSIQFRAKPLFENVSVTFGNGNRYGLIGANGCGK
jgi:ATPase subunit of ABC transporter with duplicated ATPase domains